MPIEIRELHITTVVNDSSSTTTGTKSSATSPASPDTDAIIAACVEQVLQILDEKKER